jgi:hypothetical protein
MALREPGRLGERHRPLHPVAVSLTTATRAQRFRDPRAQARCPWIFVSGEEPRRLAPLPLRVFLGSGSAQGAGEPVQRGGQLPVVIQLALGGRRATVKGSGVLEASQSAVRLAEAMPRPRFTGSVAKPTTQDRRS